MAFIPMTRGMRVAMEYSLAGQLVVNVYHVQGADPIATVNLTEVAALFLEWWDTGFPQAVKDIMTSDIALQRVVVTDISAPDGEQVIEEPVTPIAGIDAGDSVPNNVAAVVGMRNVFTGRSRRGRNYYAGLPESSIVNNVIDTALATYMLEMTDELATELDAGGYTLGVASFVSAGAPRVAALFTPASVFTMDSIVDSQRRRLPGRGA